MFLNLCRGTDAIANDVSPGGGRSDIRTEKESGGAGGRRARYTRWGVSGIVGQYELHDLCVGPLQSCLLCRPYNVVSRK